jgi:hypothetical protein
MSNETTEGEAKPRTVGTVLGEHRRLLAENQCLHDEIDRLRFGGLDLATAWRRQAVGVSGFMPASGHALLKCADELEAAMSQDQAR